MTRRALALVLPMSLLVLGCHGDPTTAAGAVPLSTSVEKPATKLKVNELKAPATGVVAPSVKTANELRHRSRAVTTQDFSKLAAEQPGVAVHRVDVSASDGEPEAKSEANEE